MANLTLHDFHLGRGARFATVGAAEVVTNYGDEAAEYAALREGAGVLDLSFRGRTCVTGADRARFLHGQVTNDVTGLKPGGGTYAALITAKGKMQSDLNIYRLADELLLDFEPGLTEVVTARLEKYIIADDVQIVDAAPHYGLLSVQGPKAEAVVRSLGLAGELPAKAFGWVAAGETGGEIYLMNQPRLGGVGFDLFVPMAQLGEVMEELLAAGGTLCGWEAFETARIEAGIPRFGMDMDETNIPLEAGLEGRAVSFAKGCYIGQEVISRIHTYSEVAKALRGLRLADGLAKLPVKGDKLFHEGKEVGYVTSVLDSKALGAKVALGYVRKEVNQIGSELVLKTDGQESAVTVAGLPFRV
jgi:folate-binding protein YgfZ